MAVGSRDPVPCGMRRWRAWGVTEKLGSLWDNSLRMFGNKVQL